MKRIQGLALLLFLVAWLGSLILAQPPPSWAQSASASQRLFLPVIYRDYQPLPLYATSYYIQDETPARLYDLGCALGTRDRQTPGAQDSLVVLNFGQGWFEGGNLSRPGAGAFSPYWHYMPISAIETAVQAYIQGYWVCSAEDQTSQVMVAVGTNNYGGYGSNSTNQDTRRTYAYAHGKAWAQMVVRLLQWVWSNGYGRQVSVAGAIDIEWDAQLTGWNTPYVTYGWVNGFNDWDNNQAIYYNFGACVGCPTSPNPGWVYSSANPWTQYDVYRVSYGVQPAWPLPEIYATSGVNARQWQAISRYGALYLGWPMEFAGVMTQYQACQQRGGCSGINNTPEAGWMQLRNALNADALTYQPILRWITDIRWQIR